MTHVQRPAEDILGRVVRVTLGDTVYQLPVRSIKANRDWKAALDSGLVGLLEAMTAAGADGEAISTTLSQYLDEMIELLLSYDTVGILPTKDEIEVLEPDASRDVYNAVREVWRAANPLLVMAVRGMVAQSIPTEPSLPPTSSPPTSITGRRTSSKSA